MKWIEKLIKIMKEEHCPSFVIDGAPHTDIKTQVISNGKITGCNGKTCEKCWNEEVPE